VCECGKHDHIDASPQKKTAQSDYKEALVNGQRFRTANVVRSIGWAEGSTGKACCFTACLNGLYVPDHLVSKDAGHAERAEFVTLYHAEYPEGVQMKVADMKKIGNDSLWMPRPASYSHEKVPNRKWNNPKVGAKIKLIAFATRAEALSGDYHDDSSIIQSVVSNPGQEKAIYKLSSVDGNCGAAVVDCDGNLVGWHNATGAGYTVFIPCTSMVVQTATGSAKSF
jgi:hypothetical protein